MCLKGTGLPAISHHLTDSSIWYTDSICCALQATMLITHADAPAFSVRVLVCLCVATCACVHVCVFILSSLLSRLSGLFVLLWPNPLVNLLSAMSRTVCSGEWKGNWFASLPLMLTLKKVFLRRSSVVEAAGKLSRHESIHSWANKMIAFCLVWRLFLQDNTLLVELCTLSAEQSPLWQERLTGLAPLRIATEHFLGGGGNGLIKVS